MLDGDTIYLYLEMQQHHHHHHHNHNHHRHCHCHQQQQQQQQQPPPLFAFFRRAVFFLIAFLSSPRREAHDPVKHFFCFYYDPVDRGGFVIAFFEFPLPRERRLSIRKKGKKSTGKKESAPEKNPRGFRTPLDPCRKTSKNAHQKNIKKKGLGPWLGCGSPDLGVRIERRANSPVQCKREVILLEAQIADLPRNNPHHGGGGRVSRTPSSVS
jgi:hypothetical protein